MWNVVYFTELKKKVPVDCGLTALICSVAGPMHLRGVDINRLVLFFFLGSNLILEKFFD